MVLFCFNLLPALNRGSTGEIPFGFSCWSLWSGFFATSLVIIFWQPQSRVFLDRICISQMDHELKTRGIISLAGMLKQSDSMLILWDPTWTERLWCLFELAAFLQSKKDQKKELTHHQANLFRASSHCFLLDHGCCHNSFHNGTGRSRSWSKSIFCSCYHDRFLERGGCLCGHEHLAKLFPRFGHHATSVAVHLFRRYSEFLLRKQPS